MTHYAWATRGSRIGADASVNENNSSDIKCPKCGHLTSKVVDSRGGSRADYVRRRRECLECAERFTTYECSDHPALAAERVKRMIDAFSKELKLVGLYIDSDAVEKE